MPGSPEPAPALIVIPARGASTRLPMKPLLPIAGWSLLHRTIATARRAIVSRPHVRLVVATDDDRIARHAGEVGCEAVMTPCDIASGSGRALAAAQLLADGADVIVNMQGDSPFLPDTALAGILDELAGGSADCATPVVALDWPALDRFRHHKSTSPFSGTTCVRHPDGRALWFSKQILPAIRDEGQWRRSSDVSPVWRHVGLYAYRRHALSRFEATPPTALERLEGLEQLRLLELGMTIATVAVQPARFDISGIDTVEDIARAEALIAQHGDPHVT